MRQYLVFFVVDEVDDALAAEVRRRIQELSGARPWRDSPPGFFDDPNPAPEAPRTMGGYLRVTDATADGDDARAFCVAIQALSTDVELEIELQWRETVIGRLHAGVPDDGLEEALAAVTGESL